MNYVTPVCGTSDDTSAVQAAIDTGEPVMLPPGNVTISSLDLTNRLGTYLIGSGQFKTNIIPIQTGVPVLDCTGASHTTIRDFHISGYPNSTVKPSFGILNAQPADAYSSDAMMVNNVRIDGYFQTAAWMMLGLASSAIWATQVYNYEPGAQVLIVTGNNFWGATSPHTAVDNTNTNMPSDITFTQVELHNIGSSNALWIGGATSIRFYGGNMSSSGIPVSINAVLDNTNTARYPVFNILDGVTFYNDFAPAPPRAITNNAGAGSAPLLRGNHSAFPIY